MVENTAVDGTSVPFVDTPKLLACTGEDELPEDDIIDDVSMDDKVGPSVVSITNDEDTEGNEDSEEIPGAVIGGTDDTWSVPVWFSLTVEGGSRVVISMVVAGGRREETATVAVISTEAPVVEAMASVG